ncbi:MAG: glycosyltransferase [Patescibacteria group bacterium]
MIKLLSISTDRNLFKADSAVRARQIDYARERDETHIIVFATRDFNFKPEKIAENCFVYSTNSSSKWFYIFDAIALGGKIISEQVITNLTCQDPFLTGLTGWWLKRCARKINFLNLEIQVHTDIGSQYFAYTFGNKIRKKIAKFVLPRADQIRVVSERIKNFLVREWGIVESKITVKPIFVDTDKIKKAEITVDLHQKYPEFSKIALIASRLEPEKNIYLPLKAWQQVIKVKPQAGLVIVGAGAEEDNLKFVVKKLKLENNVIFEPWQTNLATYYKTADLFLLTSFFEGYGLTLMEAQAAGCKIISTDVGVAREVGTRIVGYQVGEITQAIIENL